jgi:hypothetical protein
MRADRCVILWRYLKPHSDILYRHTLLFRFFRMKVTTRKKDNLPGTGSWGQSKQNKNCCYCETSVPIAKVTREHIIPKHAGGRLVRPCCQACNREKGGMLLDEYIVWLYAKYRLDWTLNYREKRKLLLKLRNAIGYLICLQPDKYNFL